MYDLHLDPQEAHNLYELAGCRVLRDSLRRPLRNWHATQLHLRRLLRAGGQALAAITGVTAVRTTEATLTEPPWPTHSEFVKGGQARHLKLLLDSDQTLDLAVQAAERATAIWVHVANCSAGKS